MLWCWGWRRWPIKGWNASRWSVRTLAFNLVDKKTGTKYRCAMIPIVSDVTVLLWWWHQLVSSTDIGYWCHVTWIVEVVDWTKGGGNSKRRRFDFWRRFWFHLFSLIKCRWSRLYGWWCDTNVGQGDGPVSLDSGIRYQMWVMMVVIDDEQFCWGTMIRLFDDMERMLEFWQA